jgi:hypothetical protein
MAGVRTAEFGGTFPTFQGSLEWKVWSGQFRKSKVA